METLSSDYTRVAAAIRFLDAHRAAQPSLADVAAHVGLSESHLQRLFRRWAGVSPKRFLQYLTAEHAKALLREGASVLDATYDAGLSGPGRLHDLLVSLEAMTPGEYKREGAGLTVRYGVHATPFGDALLGETERGVCGLAFLGGSAEEGPEAALADLRARWSRSRFVADEAGTGAVARRIFEPGSDPLPLCVQGTNFQVRVWEALLRIPPGAATTYGALADALGQPTVSRAVGSAVGANPVGVLIPCHRVLRQTGAFGAYCWGAERKRLLLGWESAQREAVAA